jgi:glycosyltransferase involved in cell wall biosynthesis
MPDAQAQKKPGLLLVANWDSNVGYAWWLMESYWVRLAREYADRYSVYLAYPEISEIPAAILDAPIECVHLSFSPAYPAHWPARLAFLRKHRIQVMYLTDQPTYTLGYFLYRALGVRCVITHDHAPGLRLEPSGLKKIIKTYLNRMPWISATACFAATEFVHSRLVRVNCVPAKKCFVVANGIRLDENPEDAAVPQRQFRQQWDITNSQLMIVTVARANQYKGIDFALKLLAHWHKTKPDSPLVYVLVGDGPNLADFKLLAAELGVSPWVRFVGRIDRVDTCLREADVAIHPSQGEVGYCLAILEYMLAGLPVLVPNNPSVCGATQDGETGLIYTADAVASAFNQLQRLVESAALRQTLGQAASEQVKRQFTLDKTHAALVQHFDSVLLRK